MIRKSLLVVAAAIACALFAGLPAGAQYPGPITLEIDDTQVSAGQTVNLSGSGCEPGAEVVFTLNGQVIGSTTAEGDKATKAAGDYSAEVTLPADLAPGQYEIVATCGDQQATVTITVLGSSTPGGPTTPGGGGTLSRTGTDLTTPVAIGVGLLALGAVVLALAGGRRSRTA